MRGENGIDVPPRRRRTTLRHDSVADQEKNNCGGEKAGSAHRYAAEAAKPITLEAVDAKEMERIPTVSLKQLNDHPELWRQFSGKVVFAGVTAQTEVRDRWLTPYSPMPMPGHVIVAGHGHVFRANGTLVPGACGKIPPGMSTFE